MATRLWSDLTFAPADVRLERRRDGTLVLRSPQPLGPHARAVGEWLLHWASVEPGRLFLAERDGDGWREVTYGEALAIARATGQALLDLGLDAGRPVVALSDNGIDHALLALGAMHVGVPVVPVSPAYSLLSRDFGKLRHILDLVRPGLVYAREGERFAPALAAVGLRGARLVVSAGAAGSLDALRFAALAATPPTDAVDRAFARLAPDSCAKILFTSGSTGVPKGVINTHRMLCANQQQIAQAWPWVEARPPVIVDWLPWSHTFGGNHDFNMVLRNGGTLYVDGGKPVPGLVEITVRNLREVSPTVYFNVPRGFDLLLPFLEADAALRASFFRRLDALFYAGAALPQNLWERLEALALAERGGRLAMLSAWGSTETAPMATTVHFPIERAGAIGLPAAGCEIKLVPAGDKQELRVRGPNVTPGYHERPDLTRAAFDEEGFYRIGDAGRLVDPAAPARGLAFDGRLAEDFKLSSGTWVSVGTVRVRTIAAGDPLIQDCVLTGHDRDEIGALVFLNPGAARALCPGAPADAGLADLAARPEVRERVRQALVRLAAESPGSSTRPARALVLAEPPGIDANEITDKGYLNQRAVLERRADLAARLHADPPPPDVITLDPGGDP